MAPNVNIHWKYQCNTCLQVLLVSCFLSSLRINLTSPRTLMSHHLGTWQLLGHGMSNWPSPFFPNTTLFSARDTWPNRILFLVNWCRLDFWCIFHHIVVGGYIFHIFLYRVFSDHFCDSASVCLSQWVVDFFEFLHVIQSTVQYIHTLHAFFLFFLLAFFFLFVVRCRSLLFHDDWTLMQFCIIFALCREQIFQLFGESNVCLRMQHFTHKFLYVRFPSRPNGLEFKKALVEEENLR